MGVWAYLHPIPSARLAELLANPDTIADAIFFPQHDAERLPEYTVEKAWDGIGFILDRLAKSGRIPSFGPPTAGKATGASFDGINVMFRTPAEVNSIAQALTSLSIDDLRERYRPDAMAVDGVYPEVWDRVGETEENFKYICGWYKHLVAAYCYAAQRGQAMLLRLG